MFTSEFWMNVFWETLQNLVVGIGIIVVLYILANSLNIIKEFNGPAQTVFTYIGNSRWMKENKTGDEGCLILIIILIFAVLIGLFSFYFIGEFMEHRVLYQNGPTFVQKLKEENISLYINYQQACSASNREKDRLLIIRDELQKTTSAAAKEMFEKQMHEARDRRNAFEKLQQRIENYAVQLYFTKYLDKLEKNTISDDFRKEMEDIKKECESLMKLHATE